MRDTYLQGGKHPAQSILRDLDTFFKGIRITAITVKKLDEFKSWREYQARVQEYEKETLAKEIELRKQKALKVRK
jgi:hypothetical protein